MIPARLTPRPGATSTVFRAYCDGRLLAELVCPDDADLEQVGDDLWRSVAPTVAAGHKVLLAAYDEASGLPLPAGDTLVAAS